MPCIGVHVPTEKEEVRESCCLERRSQQCPVQAEKYMVGISPEAAGGRQRRRRPQSMMPMRHAIESQAVHLVQPLLVYVAMLGP